MSADEWLPYYRDLLKVCENKVEEVMTREVIAVSEGGAAGMAAQILIEAEKRQLPVVRDGKPVGMTNRLDLIKAFTPNPG